LFRKRHRENASLLRIAVVIPAHDEELIIEATLKHLLGAAYPRERYRVFVIADNCSDATAAIAARTGVTVFERNDRANCGKGFALQCFLQSNMDTLQEWDIIAIIDADTIINPSFFSALACKMGSGECNALQGRYVVANPGDNWRTALTYAGFSLINHVRPMGRDALGASVGLFGNGMAFKRDVLLKMGWQSHSIVEDLEFALMLLLAGFQVRYCPEAIVSSAMPASRGQATSQRRRWELGRMQVARQYVPKLLAAFLRRPRWCYLDAALDLMVPPLAMYVLLQVLVGLVALCLGHPTAFLALACLVGTAIHVTAGLILSRAPWRVWMYLLAVPFFLAWKVMLYAQMLVKPSQKAWVRTSREGEADRR
jgi:cellulose synthase/poly-beta-1,6-N-acetylglucosamine synthase-like glycosyltransferase